MRKIVTRTTSVLYQFKNCKTKYKSKNSALKCESESVEDKIFKKGDRVTWIEERTCVYGGTYKIYGRVTTIRGPQLPDEEYNIKWLQRRLTGKHVYMYKVDWICPHCKQNCSGIFYSLELIKL